MEQKLTEQLVKELDEESLSPERRKELFKERKLSRLKELIMQDVSKSSTNRSFTQYTKSLIKSYLQNPFSNRDSVREVSRYLYRMSSVYKKIILYYATMPQYNYNVTMKTTLSEDFDVDSAIKDYEKVLKRLHKVNFVHEFSTAIALAIRDGVYCSYIYDSKDNGLFMHVLDPQYYRLRGKNEAGVWVVAFDASYFTKGSNVQFVDGVNGDTSGCWDQVFIDGYRAYQNDIVNSRWFELPPEKTLTLLANLDDEFDIALPFYSGIFISLLDLMDAEQIVADKTALQNFALLVSKIPLLKSDDPDEYAVSLEIVQEIQAMIDAVLPDLVGSFYTPLDVDLINFGDNVNTTKDVDTLSTSMNNLFNQAGPPQIVVGGGASTTATALKAAIANDASLTFLWLSRLEANFQYYIEKNINKNFMISFHRQTHFYQEDYINRLREVVALGNAPMDLLTALGNTPYLAWCKLKFEKAIGIRDLMIPLQTSYTLSSKDAGRPEMDEGDLSESGVSQRENDGNETAKGNK